MVGWLAGWLAGKENPQRNRQPEVYVHAIGVNFRKSKKRPDISAKCTGVKFLDALLLLRVVVLLEH